MTDDLDPVAIERSARERLATAADEAALRAIEREYLDKGGVIAGLLAAIPTVEPARRRDLGQAANRLKAAVQEGLAARREQLRQDRLSAELAAADFDPTLPGARLRTGSLHPLTQVRRQVEDIFLSMGYRIEDGPEVELDYYNFQALNIPVDHPSREEQDTFYCDREHRLVMRTQTSPVQIRAMERLVPPFRLIAPGRVFRNEAQDATHEHTFHQVEGLAVGFGVHVGHLTYTLRSFLEALFGRPTEVRLRPGYFPFVEPGFEFDMACSFCGGRGCRVCKQSGWIEFCGCGMVHRRVLEAGFAGRTDVDVAALTGFAFGFGLDRLTMSRYGIDDLRHFFGGDLRFLEQF
jgi:phenylalanyl-tRNA synthetase alpha chain